MAIPDLSKIAYTADSDETFKTKVKICARYLGKPITDKMMIQAALDCEQFVVANDSGAGAPWDSSAVPDDNIFNSVNSFVE